MCQRENVHLQLSLPGVAGAQVLGKAEKKKSHPSVLHYVRPVNDLLVLYLL